MKRIVKFLAVVCLFAPSLFGANAVSRATASEIGQVIHASGNALFFDKYKNERRLLWTVTCRVPMEGCIARGQNILVWVDGELQPRLTSALAPGGRIFLINGNKKKELPLILSRPLDDETVRNLSRNGVELIIEERQIITQRSRTHGIDSIVSYLRWLKSNEARLSKDARLWQKDDGLFLGRSNASPLERFRIAAFQRGDNPELLVPVDKPQIQFAISGQKNN